MFCSLCQKFYPSDNSAFISKGCKDYKTSPLLRHTSSKKHQSAAERENLAKTANIRSAFNRTITASEKSVVASMKTAYFLAKEDLPMSKHSSVIDFLKHLKCPALNDSPSCTYSHSNSIAEFHEVF